MKTKKKDGASYCPLSRRSFIKKSALAAAALSVQPSTVFSSTPPAPAPKSIVAVSENMKAISDSYKIDPGRVREMIDEGIKALTGTPSAKEGWLRIFPNLKEKEVIGLKPNSVNPKLPAHPQVAYALVDSMADAGINKSNILIWDNVDQFLTRAGYTINTSEKGYRCYSTYHDESIGHDPEAGVTIKSVDLVRYHSRILSRHIDYLINVPVLKSADPPGITGVTLSLKNMYGTISIAEGASIGVFAPDLAEVVTKLHDHNADPQIAELNAGKLLMEKTKLVVLDALMGIYQGAPSADPGGVSHKIVMSRDRVAADVTGFDIINAKRKEMGIDPVSKETAGHIWSAEKLGIGNADPAKIEMRHVKPNVS
jgi:uncharacterized protein (DUF362 family)